MVDKIAFNSGDDVTEGALLLTLRAEDDVAKLQSLQAAADLSEITYQRDLKQLKIQAVSQATLDTDDANLRNARAQVAQQKAILDKKFLRAPFAGHLGIRAVDLGQFLAAGTAIVTLQALDPIYLDFFVPQIPAGTPGIPCGTVNGTQTCDTLETAFGYTGRNTFRGPFQERFDLSAVKETKLKDRKSVV